jgi:hypothetical protein
MADRHGLGPLRLVALCAALVAGLGWVHACSRGGPGPQGGAGGVSAGDYTVGPTGTGGDSGGFFGRLPFGRELLQALVAADATHAYVLSNTRGLVIDDLVPGSSPQPNTTVPLDGAGVGLHIDGENALVVLNGMVQLDGDSLVLTSELDIIAVPRGMIRARLPLTGHVEQVVFGKAVVYALGQDGLTSVDVRDADHPVAHPVSPGSNVRWRLDGQLAYRSEGCDPGPYRCWRTTILDLSSDPPREIGLAPQPAEGPGQHNFAVVASHGVAVSATPKAQPDGTGGTCGFGSDGLENHLQVLSLAPGVDAQPIGSLELPPEVEVALTLFGGNLVVLQDAPAGSRPQCSGSPRLRLVDLANPVRPTLAGTIDLEGTPVVLLLRGDRLFVLSTITKNVNNYEQDHVLIQYDLSQPAAPREVNRQLVGTTANGAATRPRSLTWIGDAGRDLLAVHMGGPQVTAGGDFQLFSSLPTGLTRLGAELKLSPALRTSFAPLAPEQLLAATTDDVAAIDLANGMADVSRRHIFPLTVSGALAAPDGGRWEFRSDGRMVRVTAAGERKLPADIPLDNPLVVLPRGLAAVIRRAGDAVHAPSLELQTFDDAGAPAGKLALEGTAAGQVFLVGDSTVAFAFYAPATCPGPPSDGTGGMPPGPCETVGGNFHLIDVSDLAAPRLTATVTVGPDYALNASWSQDGAVLWGSYLESDDRGSRPYVDRVDLQTAGAPAIDRHLSVPGRVLAVHGDIIFTLADKETSDQRRQTMLSAARYRPGARATLLSELDVGAVGAATIDQGRALFLSSDVLVLVDLSVADRLRVASRMSLPHPVLGDHYQGITLFGQHAFVTTPLALLVIDVHELEAPRLRTLLPIPGLRAILPDAHGVSLFFGPYGVRTLDLTP